MAKKLIVNFFLLILGIVIAFSAGEIILRTRGVLSLGETHQYDPRTGLVTLVPGSINYTEKCLTEPVLVEANSQGFRDEEFEIEKPADVFRIAVFGDSYTEARHVLLKNSFHGILENKLKELASNKKIEIYSFGIGGSGTFRNFLYLNQYGLKYKPDLVILAFLPMNDFRDDYAMLSEIFDQDGKIKTELTQKEKLSKKSILLTWLRYKWQVFKTHGLASRLGEAQVPFDFQVFLKEYPESWQKIWDLEKTLIGRMNRTSRESGAKFMILTLADVWRIHPELMANEGFDRRFLDKFEFDFDKPEKILNDWARDQDIAFLNLTPIFRERVVQEKKMTVLYPCDAHWSETGHLWAGEALFQFLKDNDKLIDIDENLAD